jgi:chorismate mutase-like protein
MARLLHPALLCLGMLSLLAGCSSRPGAAIPAQVETLDTRPVAELLGLMRERLDLMHDVARWKWNESKPIEDEPREQALLAAMVQRGQELGLDSPRVRGFFRDQIEAAKAIQRHDFARWRAAGQGRFVEIADLAALRQRIDQLNHALLDTLAELQPSLQDPDQARAVAAIAEETLSDPEFPDDLAWMATDTLRSR